MERLVGVARDLSEKIESNETAAGELLRQCETLQEELKSMRKYRECVGVISGGDEEGRVKLPNIEFSYIKQLQQDNSELRTLLEEHQAALEMIMAKYREQVSQFMAARVEEVSMSEHHMAEELQHLTDQVYNMAAVMYKAAMAEDDSSVRTLEQVAQLEYENQHLRELLQFSTSMMEDNERIQPSSVSPQTRAAPPPPPTADGPTASPGLRTIDSLTLNSTPSGHGHTPHPPGGTPPGYESGDSRCSTPRAEDHTHTAVDIR